MKGARRIAAISLIAFVFFGLASCANNTTAVGVTTTQDADHEDKQLR